MEEGLEYTVPRVLQGISLVLGKDPEKHQLKLELFDIPFHNGKLNILVEKYVQWIFSYLKKKKKIDCLCWHLAVCVIVKLEDRILHAERFEYTLFSKQKR